MNYQKPYVSPVGLIPILESRGLVIRDKTDATDWLKRVGYYRLSGYFYPFLSLPKTAHKFRNGVCFGQVKNLYRFDSEFRHAVFAAIESVEVALRSAVSNIMASETGDPFWMTNPVYFTSPHKYAKTLRLIQNECNRSTEDFIEHFRSVYSDPFPPSWALAEILPFGVITRLYENIGSHKARKRIAAEFNLSAPVFLSWVVVTANMRNTCCHHGRLWNRSFALRTLVPKNTSASWVSANVNQHRLFYRLCIIKWFLDIVRPGNDLKRRLKALLAEYPMVDTRAMGFPDNREREPLWAKDSNGIKASTPKRCSFIDGFREWVSKMINKPKT